MKKTISRSGGLLGKYVLAASLFIVALGAFLRIYNLGANSFSLIECTIAIWAKMPIGKLIQQSFDAVHPPAYYFLIHYWMSFFGSSEFSLRLLSVVFGTASIYVVFKIGARLLGKFPALIAALIFAASPISIYVSRQAKMYSWSSFFVLLSVWFLIRMKDGGRLRYWVGYAVSIYVALLLSFSSVAALAFEFLFSFFLWQGDKRTLKKFIFLFILIVVLFFPFPLLVLSVNHDPVGRYVRGMEIGHIYHSLFNLLQFLGFLPSLENRVYYSKILSAAAKTVFYISPCFMAFFAFKGLCNLLAERRTRKMGMLLFFWIVIPVGTVFFFVFVLKHYFENLGYIYFILGAYYLLFAYGMVRLRNKWLMRAVFLIQLFFIVFTAATYYYFTREDQWREAVSFVSDNFSPGEKVFIMERQGGGDCVRCYWGRGEDKLVSFFSPEQRKEQTQKYFLEKGCRGVWIVWARSRAMDNLIEEWKKNPKINFLFSGENSFLYNINVCHFKIAANAPFEERWLEFPLAEPPSVSSRILR